MPDRTLSWAPVAPGGKHDHYDCLPCSRSIRLLELQERTHGHPRLCYSLRSYPLDDVPPYTALSYSWKGAVFTDAEIAREDDDGAAAEPFYEIEIDSRSKMVGDNLFHALTRLADDDPSSTTEGGAHHLYWVDALCINQRDLPEREAQVLLMGDVYAGAARVVVWLGREADDVREFAWLHARFVPALDRLIDRRGVGVLRRSPLDAVFRDGSGLDVAEWYRRWWAYFRFFRARRWFYRAWVVQEVALAGRVDVLVGADVVLPWATVFSLAKFVLCGGWGQVLAPPRQARKDAGLGEMETMWLMQEVYREGASWSCSAQGLRKSLEKVFGAETEEQMWYVFLIWAVDKVRTQRASNPRDHIYAILGIAERFIPLGIERLIVPNYSATPEAVYTGVASVFLGKLPFLSTLSMLEDPSERSFKSLPSWVPDWSVHGSCPVRIGWASRDGNPLFDASLVERSEQLSCWIEGSRLLLQGARFDTVVETSDPLRTIMTEYRASSLFNLCRGMKRKYSPTGQTRQEALWRTLVLDELDNNYPALPSSSSQFRDWARMSLAAGLYLCEKDTRARSKYLKDISCLDELSCDEGSLLSPSAVVKDEAKTLAKVFDSIADNQEEWSNFQRDFDGESMQFASRLSCTGASRRLYSTARGFVGLGPESTKKGDQIWMILGARVPFVLRNNPRPAGSFKMIGETYVHGFMHGAMRELVGGKVREISIV
ncbi:hypothetical protein SLS58_003474 [Diplodia intermedia]|uniref:Heterokaryon incompatibility domain-containing protein n=1 Tax=Diplodia intermedia TaxID=856260 RepID=A0ABR3TWH3_9PEZI